MDTPPGHFAAITRAAGLDLVGEPERVTSYSNDTLYVRSRSAGDAVLRVCWIGDPELTENRDRLADGATPVRVEGVMDALAVTKASGGRAVGLAPLGTALTAAQADQLAHAAKDRLVLHATDDDPAGLKAAGRDYGAPHRPRHRRP